MVGDLAHSRLLAAGWLWREATFYTRELPSLALTLAPLAQAPDEMPTEERLRKLRTGRWVLSRGPAPLAAFDSFAAATTSILLAAASVE